MPRYPQRSSAFNLVAGIAFIIILAIISVFALAVFNSKNTVDLTIRSKERVCSSADDCKYLIFTETGVYQNSDTLFAGKFNSSDIYNELEPGKTYSVTVWGFRQPILSLYPNILEIKNV